MNRIRLEKIFIMLWLVVFFTGACSSPPKPTARPVLPEKPDVVVKTQITTSVPAASTTQVAVPEQQLIPVKRDPFSLAYVSRQKDKAGDEEAGKTEEKAGAEKILQLQGIWGDDLQRYCIINDEVLKEGDSIYNYVIKRILWNQVVVSDGRSDEALYLEEPEK